MSSESQFYSSRAVVSKHISSQDLTRLCLDRIERLDSSINAFNAINPKAMEDARESDARVQAGEPRSPLEGVPVAVKDNILVGGLPATWGSPLFADFVPDDDELPIATLRAAGAVIVGKTNTPEFSARGYTDNPVFGPTRNPWNIALTPGGSSGGSAAAVAAGMVPLALGTDGGGSTRRPAGHTGVVGFKPSIGRIPRDGGFPSILLDFEVIGPIGRSVADVRILTECLSISSKWDPRSRFFPALTSQGTLKTLRIGFIEQFETSPVDPDIRTSMRHAADRLGDMGHEVVPTRLPFTLRTIGHIQETVLNAGFAFLAAQNTLFFEKASPPYIEQARIGASLDASTIFAVLDATTSIRAATGRLFDDFDVILTPTTAAQPWPATEVFPSTIDGQDAAPKAHAAFTGWVNVCGHPGISIPVDPDPKGLPIGMQLVGDMGADQLLLDLAQNYEDAYPWHPRMPAMLAV